MNAIEIELDESEYNDYLDSCYGDIDVCGVKVPASQVLEDVDPTRYKVGFADWSSENVKYKCSECNTEYDDYYDADECCGKEEEEDE